MRFLEPAVKWFAELSGQSYNPVEYTLELVEFLFGSLMGTIAVLVLGWWVVDVLQHFRKSLRIHRKEQPGGGVERVCPVDQQVV